MNIRWQSKCLSSYVFCILDWHLLRFSEYIFVNIMFVKTGRYKFACNIVNETYSVVSNYSGESNIIVFSVILIQHENLNICKSNSKTYYCV